jgi:hypothetical protein
VLGFDEYSHKGIAEVLLYNDTLSVFKPHPVAWNNPFSLEAHLSPIAIGSLHIHLIVEAFS